MNKKLIAVVCIIWGIVIVSGVMFFQMRSSSKKINIIEITNKEKVVTEEGKVEKINFYVVSDNVDKLLRKEKEIPLYIKPCILIPIFPKKNCSVRILILSILFHRLVCLMILSLTKHWK